MFYVPANTVGYRLYGRRFLQVKRPNQQYQSILKEPFDAPFGHNNVITSQTTAAAIDRRTQHCSISGARPLVLPAKYQLIAFGATALRSKSDKFHAVSNATLPCSVPRKMD